MVGQDGPVRSGAGGAGGAQGDGTVAPPVFSHLLLARIRYDHPDQHAPDWLRDAAKQFGATLVSSLGDPLFSLPTPRACLDLAMCIQLHKAVRPLDWGAVVVFAGDDGYGPSARARRLESLADRARIGQVFAVGKVIDTLAPVTTNLRTVRLGTHRFEDMLPAEDVVSLSVGADFEAPTFSLEGLDLYDHNLPVFFDSFVGRDGMIDEVIGAASTTRLVTLVGCGGVGKTRLAVHAAARLMLDGFHVLRLVRLAEADRSADVGSVVAAQSGIRSARFDDFVEAYRAKRFLLVIDNCEHILDSAVAAVRRIVSEIPGALVLVTSREALDLGGEVVIEVPPLSLPVEEYDVNSARACGAVELFVDRLCERADGFRFGPDCVDVIVSICRRLDGLPLALEHAAGQAGYLGLDECERGLSRRFELLRSERRDYDERHRTVWATIDWSYWLLSEEEKHCLGSLSVLTGSFSMGDALAIAPDDVVGITDAPGLLASLIRKSLVVREFDSRGNALYHLLETVREFAREKSANRIERLCERHFEYVRGLIESAYEASEGRESSVKFGDLKSRYSDVKAVLDWAVEARLSCAGETLRLMTRYWNEYGPISDGVDLLSRAVLPSINAADFSCGEANALAAMFWMDGQYDRALPIFERVLARAVADSDHVVAANAHNNLAGVLMHTGNMEVAEGHLRCAHDTYLQAGEVSKAAMCAANLGYSLTHSGKVKEAMTVLEGALGDGGDGLPVETAVVLLLNLSDAFRLHGDPDGCGRVLCRLLEVCASADHLSTVPSAILRACLILQDRCDAQSIARMYGMASQGFAEYSSAEFSDRSEMRVALTEFLEHALDSPTRDRLIASGTVVSASQRTAVALEIIKKALDTPVD